MKKRNFFSPADLKMLVVLIVFCALSTNAMFSQTLDSTIIKNGSSFRLISLESKGTFQDNGASINRDAKIVGNGIVSYFNLLKLNEKTGDFNSTFVKGKFLKGKAVVICEKSKMTKYCNYGCISFSATKIDSLDKKIVLKGNAKIFTKDQKEYIEANEIVIEVVDSIKDYIDKK